MGGGGTSPAGKAVQREWSQWEVSRDPRSFLWAAVAMAVERVESNVSIGMGKEG